MKDSMVLALIRKGWAVEDADAFVAGLEESQPDLFTPPRYTPAFAGPGAPIANPAAAIPMMQGVARASGLPIPAINQAGLKAAQLAAYAAAGATLCPNCQQPTTDHLPGCSRHDRGPDSFGADKKAITKGSLPPVG